MDGALCRSLSPWCQRMKKLFIAYPAEPAIVGETIEHAKADAEKSGPNIAVTTWREAI